MKLIAIKHVKGNTEPSAAIKTVKLRSFAICKIFCSGLVIMLLIREKYKRMEKDYILYVLLEELRIIKLYP